MSDKDFVIGFFFWTGILLLGLIPRLFVSSWSILLLGLIPRLFVSSWSFFEPEWSEYVLLTDFFFEILDLKASLLIESSFFFPFFFPTLLNDETSLILSEGTATNPLPLDNEEDKVESIDTFGIAFFFPATVFFFFLLPKGMLLVALMPRFFSLFRLPSVGFFDLSFLRAIRRSSSSLNCLKMSSFGKEVSIFRG